VKCHKYHQNRLTGYVTDDPEAYDGAPVGLQIVARKYDEEKVWAIAKIVDTILRSYKAAP
jgi:Asp-tRNA(Asn)/Glu-tRNA(Gln) amidotransferase A subunit family amidase